MEAQVSLDGLALISISAGSLALAVGVAAESALHEYSHSRLDEILEKDSRRERILKRLDDFEHLAMALAVFNVIAVIAVSLAFGRWAIGGSDLETGTLITCGIVVPAILYAFIRRLASYFAEAVLIKTIDAAWLISVLLMPITRPTAAFAAIFGRSLGAEPSADKTEAAVDEILDAVAEGEAGGALEKDAADLIENIIDLNDLAAHQVMTPRTSMVCVKKGAPLADVVELFNRGRHFQLPVFEENRDNILGMLAMIDVLANYEKIRRGEITLESLAQPPYFIPETKRASDLLREMKRDGQRIAIVLDEFGGTLGLVTLEDIVEEIVGELGGASSKHIHRVDDRQIEIDAKMPIDYLNERFKLQIPEDGDYETVGGWLASALGKVPEKGENYALEGVKFEVTDADERKVKRVRVTTGVVLE